MDWKNKVMKPIENHMISEYTHTHLGEFIKPVNIHLTVKCIYYIASYKSSIKFELVYNHVTRYNASVYSEEYDKYFRNLDDLIEHIWEEETGSKISECQYFDWMPVRRRWSE